MDDERWLLLLLATLLAGLAVEWATARRLALREQARRGVVPRWWAGGWAGWLAGWGSWLHAPAGIRLLSVVTTSLGVSLTVAVLSWLGDGTVDWAQTRWMGLSWALVRSIAGFVVMPLRRRHRREVR